MFDQIYNIINKYDTIVISRHKRPDLDALGSSIGLKYIILDNFKGKKVYVVGDMVRPSFIGTMDDIEKVDTSNSLLIYTDCSTENMIYPLDLAKFDKVICIDHHNNVCDLNALAFYNTKAAAACQIIAEFAFAKKLVISNEAAKCLFAGIVSDTNRFNFSLSNDLFTTVGKLIDLGFDYNSLYNIMYSDSVNYIKMKGYFMQKFIVDDHKVAYMINDLSVFDKFKVDVFTISRGMVNVMANLEGVEIWANFTQDPQTNKVLCEFRSKKIEIIEVAKKYGGGGHLLACGATVDNFDVVKDIIKDLDDLVKE